MIWAVPKRRSVALVFLLVACLLAGCGGPAVAGLSPPVPTSATYGTGAWAFTVSFLSTPHHTGVRRVRAADDVVAADTYNARFKDTGGFGYETLTIAELSRSLPLHGCALKSFEHFSGPCPSRHGNTLVRYIGPDGGQLVVASGKMAFVLQVSGASRSSTTKVFDSFSR
jgi:hypothetical protein